MLLKYIPPQFIKHEAQCVSTLSSGQQILFIVLVCAAIIFFFLSAGFVDKSVPGKKLDRCIICYGLFILFFAGSALMLGFSSTCA